MAYPPPPYADAVCGTFKAGEALAGTYWAYPPAGKLGLLGHLPTVHIDETVYISIPQASLGLGATAPEANIDTTLDVPQEELALQAVPPSLTIFQIIDTPTVNLGLGAYLPDRVGWIWIPSEEDVLGWVPSLVGTVTFDPVVADEVGWIPSRVDT